MKLACTLTLFSAALLCCVSASAQTPAPVPAPATPSARNQQRPRGPRPVPTNIKALPKNITGDQVIALMRQYEGDLGVECEFCHAQNPATKRNDFASDANPEKDVARYMITMTADLNDKWLAEMPDRRYADPITCGTCHRGEKHPSVFVPKPRAEGNRPAAATPAASFKRPYQNCPDKLPCSSQIPARGSPDRVLTFVIPEGNLRL